MLAVIVRVFSVEPEHVMISLAQEAGEKNGAHSSKQQKTNLKKESRQNNHKTLKR